MMKQREYSESIAVAEVPAHQDHSCVAACQLETVPRSKTGVTIGPGLCPSRYRDAIIVYLDSTRKRYVSRVEYTTRMKPLCFTETTYLWPKVVCRSFSSQVDHQAESRRRWYKSSVRLEPQVYTSSRQYSVSPDRQLAEVSPVEHDATMESLDYLSDDHGLENISDPLSPLRLHVGEVHPMQKADGGGSRQWSRQSSGSSTGGSDGDNKRFHYYSSELNGNTRHERYVQKGDSNGNDVVIHRSGPFIYNATKQQQRRYSADDEVSDPSAYTTRLNGHVSTNGYHNLHQGMNGHSDLKNGLNMDREDHINGEPGPDLHFTRLDDFNPDLEHDIHRDLEHGHNYRLLDDLNQDIESDLNNDLQRDLERDIERQIIGV